MLIFRSSNSRAQDTTGTIFPVQRKPKPALKADFVIEKQVVSRFFVFANVDIRRVILLGISKKAEVMGELIRLRFMQQKAAN